MAERIMRMPDTGKCPACQKDDETEKQQRVALREMPGSSHRESVSAPPVVRNVLREPGHPLDATARTFFESRFQFDFSKVRIHTDALAAESAGSIGALAFTAGRHVVFGRNQFAPETLEGTQLLAHELAHVRQQGAGAAQTPLESNGTGVIQREVSATGSGTSESPGKDGSGGQGDCSGWEGDRQSFSKRAAEHYLQKVWKPGFQVQSISCGAPQADWTCEVTVDTGAGQIVLRVHLVPGSKIVRVERLPGYPTHMVCFYQYRCEPSGKLVFEGPDCPLF